MMNLLEHSFILNYKHSVALYNSNAYNKTYVLNIVKQYTAQLL